MTDSPSRETLKIIDTLLNYPRLERHPALRAYSGVFASYRDQAS